MKKLIDYVDIDSCKQLAVIGLAKNAGKTVTCNCLVREAREKGITLALVSYGWDGEEIDSITLKKKPRIYVPPGTFFVTPEKVYVKSGIRALAVKNTGRDTVLGEVIIYKMGGEGGNVELTGVNTAARMHAVLEYLEDKADLFLIDGALDRRSSAMPSLAEGFILATGAAVGNTVDMVVSRTLYEIKRLTLPVCGDVFIKAAAKELFACSKSGLVYSGNRVMELPGNLIYRRRDWTEEGEQKNIRAFILNGALTDSFLERLIYTNSMTEFTILIRDGTKVFLNKRNMNLLQKYEICIQVIDTLDLIGVTVNPFSPYGQHLDSEKIVERLRASLQNVPVYDVMSAEYKGT